MYSLSRIRISAAVRLTDNASTESFRWCNLVAPTIGAVISAFDKTHASAICALGTFLSCAIFATASTTRLSAASVLLV